MRVINKYARDKRLREREREKKQGEREMMFL